jgi:hypothetical protein
MPCRAFSSTRGLYPLGGNSTPISTCDTKTLTMTVSPEEQNCLVRKPNKRQDRTQLSSSPRPATLGACSSLKCTFPGRPRDCCCRVWNTRQEAALGVKTQLHHSSPLGSETSVSPSPLSSTETSFFLLRWSGSPGKWHTQWALFLEEETDAW